MKFICNTKELSDAFSLLSNLVTGRNPRPTLNNIKIEAKDPTITFSATDSEIAIKYIIPKAKIEEDGSVSIPSSNIAGIFKETSDEEVTFESKNNLCKISTQDSAYKIFGDDPHNFPYIPFVDEMSSVEMPLSIFLDAIRKTIFSTAKEKTRYALNGVLLKLENDRLDMVSTDGKRLSKITKVIPDIENKEWEAILPKKALELLERISQSSEKNISISIEENIVQFRLTNITMCAKLVEGSFPNYKEVIPSGYNRKLSINTAKFFSAVKRASLFTNEGSRALTIKFDDSLLKIKSHSELAGEAELEIPIDYKEEPFEISLNPEFLNDVLRVTTRESFDIEFKESNMPIIIKSEDNYTNLVMPISSSP